jgi:hypothetical protein
MKIFNMRRGDCRQFRCPFLDFAATFDGCEGLVDSNGALGLLFATTHALQYCVAEVAELADARDSKSRGT